MHSSSPLRLWILSSTYPVVGRELERSTLLNAVHSLVSFLSLSLSFHQKADLGVLSGRSKSDVIAVTLAVLSLYKRYSGFRDYLLVCVEWSDGHICLLSLNLCNALVYIWTKRLFNEL